MKNKMKSIMFLCLLFIFPIINNFQVLGQEKINLYGGLGIPELFVIGPRFQFNQIQLGAGIGGNDAYYSLSGDASYHFGGSSQLSERLPWYIKGGLTKCFTNSQMEESPIVTYFRLGRDFNLSRKVGINLESGLLIGKVYVNEMMLGHSDSGIMPTFAIFFFYRI